MVATWLTLLKNMLTTTIKKNPMIRKQPKVDLSNPDKQEVNNMITSYKENECNEYPLYINEKLTILVPISKCTEKYRQWYIKERLQKVK